MDIRVIEQENLPLEDVKVRIEEIIKKNKIVLFMKGDPEMPRCGFSASVVSILGSFGKDFATYDILNDPELRQALKDYSNWPTYPQLYVRGELLGGSDILNEMYHSGQLQEIFKDL